MKVFHELKPIYNSNSKILILGSMASIISRQNNFYYSNPQNRFWKVIESIFDIKLPTNEEKEKFLHVHHIALWDTIASCDISGSLDSTIKNIKVNNIGKLLKETKINIIFVTGKKSLKSIINILSQKQKKNQFIYLAHQVQMLLII